MNLEVALSQLGLTMDEFIDVCILCGCDYCENIKGIGPVSAVKLVPSSELRIGPRRRRRYATPQPR